MEIIWKSNFDILFLLMFDQNTARSEIENKSNEFINRLIIKIISTVLNKKNNFYLSSLIKETKFGNVEDKIKKNLYKLKTF